MCKANITALTIMGSLDALTPSILDHSLLFVWMAIYKNTADQIVENANNSQAPVGDVSKITAYIMPCASA